MYLPILITACVTAEVALAHPGHGVGGGSYSPFHYLTEPFHGLGAVLGIVAAVMLTAVWAFRKR